MPDGPAAYLLLSAIVFVIGTMGVIVRRNAVTMLMSIELMLNAANLALVAVGRALPGREGSGIVDGQVLALFVLAVAAAEAAVGLGIVLALYRLKASTDTDLNRLLRW
ncbi:MAG: NADH-quinone oxidoreductase subunit NuoK [Acidobacteria bacterium]|nr:NADH-quinone oxidoreductase subunit NuoK [Acidobacteriota bacterium]